MKMNYYRHKLKNLLVINKIITIHYFELDKDFKSHGESHDFWELVYVDKGALLCETDTEKIILKEGELLFHKPNEYHVHYSNSEKSPNVFIISFECKSEACRFFENKKLTLNKNLLKFIYMITDESKKAFNIPYSDPDLKKMPLNELPALGSLQMIKNLLEIMLIQIMRDETESAENKSVFLHKEEFDGYIANGITAILKDNIKSKISMDEISEKLNYNKSYLFRQFKAYTGCSIMSYFTKLKIEETKKLLRFTNMTIEQIATEYGFDTPNYFTKTFKRVTGSTPSSYRKIYKEK